MLNVTMNFLTVNNKEYTKQYTVLTVKQAYELAERQLIGCGGKLNIFKPAKIELIR